MHPQGAIIDTHNQKT